jgi:hypothetical protein
MNLFFNLEVLRKIKLEKDIKERVQMKKELFTYCNKRKLRD